MDPEILAPGSFGERKDAAQIVSGERRMIEITAVFVSPLQPMFVQNFGEAVKEDGVVGADGVVGDRELQRHRDESERDNKGRAQIASGAHVSGSSSFSAFGFRKSVYCQPSTTSKGTSSNGLIGPRDGNETFCPC